MSTRRVVGIVFIGVVAVLFTFLTPRDASAVTMDFHGDGIRIASVNERVKATEIDSPESQDRQTNFPRTSEKEEQESWPEKYRFFDAVDFEVSASGYSVDISGNQRRSFKANGSHGLVDVTFDGERHYSDTQSFEFHLDLRGTDDPQKLPDKRIDLRGIYAEWLTEQVYRLRIGNVSTTFSDYTLSTSSDAGINYEYWLDSQYFDRLKIYSSRPRRESTGQLRRFNGGFRLEQTDTTSALRHYGITYATTRDDTNSSISATPIQNDVLGVDARMALGPGWTVKGELAYAQHDPNTDTGGDELDDYALKLSMDHPLVETESWKRTGLSLNYEEVQPDFRSPSAGGSPDQRVITADLRGTYDNNSSFLPSLRNRYTFDYNTNNLDGDLTDTRDFEVQSHEFQTSFKPFERWKTNEQTLLGKFYGNMEAEISIRNNQVESENGVTNRQTTNEQFNLSTDMGKQELSSFYKYRINIDKTDTTAVRRRRDYGFSYSYEDIRWISYNGMTIPTDFTIGYERTEDWAVNTPDDSDSHRWNASIVNYLHNDYRLEIQGRQSETDNPGPTNDVRRTTGKISLLKQNVYLDSGRASLSYEINDIDEEAPGNSYQEEVAKANVEFSF